MDTQNTLPEFAVGEKWDDIKIEGDGKLDPDQEEHRSALKQWWRCLVSF